MTGGMLLSRSAHAVTYLDTTETMVSEENGWKINQKHSLPHPMAYLHGISIQNNIIMIGKIDFMSTAFLAVMHNDGLGGCELPIILFRTLDNSIKV